jgi:hypothetical protein
MANEIAKTEETQVPAVMTPAATEDVAEARGNYKKLLNYGNDGLEMMLEVARDTEHPRAYEVFSNMLKTMSDINVRLVDLHRQEKQLSKDESGKTAEAPKEAGTTNNALFVGSFSALQEKYDILAKAEEAEPLPEIVEAEVIENDSST